MIHIHAIRLVRLALNPKLQINPEPLDPKTFGGLSDGPSFSELPIMVREYGSPKTWRTPLMKRPLLGTGLNGTV